MIRDDRGDLVRATAVPPHDEGFVVFAKLMPGTEARRIREEIAHFDASRRSFEWKMHAFDTPRDLEQRLAAVGFGADEAETRMVYESNGR